jgi:hypothetical protein
MSEVAGTDPLSVCDARSVKQVSAKTANHDLKALKMMFKSAPERQRHHRRAHELVSVQRRQFFTRLVSPRL